MGAGYWLNPETGMCVQVATTHDEFVRDRANAMSIGLSKGCHAQIMRYPPTAIDEIRLSALREGMVRLREHRRYLSVQFTALPQRVALVLKAVVVALTELKIHLDTMLAVDNLLSGDSVSITLRDLKGKIESGEPVMGEMDNQHSNPVQQTVS
ncbi:MAG: hypothetical protein ACLP9L_29635 [Thermoguttaceae bacterium]